MSLMEALNVHPNPHSILNTDPDLQHLDDDLNIQTTNFSQITNASRQLTPKANANKQINMNLEIYKKVQD